MDSGIWLHGYDTTNASGNNGSICGYAASSYTPAEFQYMEDDDQEQQQFLISSQVQHHHDLNHQISVPMNMDDDEAAAWMSSNYDDGATTIDDDFIDPIMDGLLDDPSHHAGTGISLPSSSSSASLSCSLDSAVVLPSPYDYDPHRYTCTPRAPAKTAGGAFKLYAWYLGPKRPLQKPGACGQRMFKTAMSVLSKMHVAARYSYYQAQAAAAAAAAAREAAPQPPSAIQMQHMFSERKRRDKLNDGFDALKAVLPPGAKKDKASILMRARECVRSLEAKVAELEEKNKSLKSRLTSGGGDHDSSGETTMTTTTKVQVEITRAANEEGARDDFFTLRIAVRSSPSSPCNNMTDVVVRTLQCLKEQIGDGVSMVAMSTGGDVVDGGGIIGTTGVNKNTSSGAVVTLQIKSPGTDWEEQPVKDAVAKVVAEALTTTATLPGQCHPRRSPPTAAAASAMLLN